VTQPSPTKLTTSRNRALQIGAASAGFAELDTSGTQPVVNAPAIHDVGSTPAPTTIPTPFAIKGG